MFSMKWGTSWGNDLKPGHIFIGSVIALSLPCCLDRLKFWVINLTLEPRSFSLQYYSNFGLLDFFWYQAEMGAGNVRGISRIGLQSPASDTQMKSQYIRCFTSGSFLLSPFKQAGGTDSDVLISTVFIVISFNKWKWKFLAWLHSGLLFSFFFGFVFVFVFRIFYTSW